jgi:hypothetical protein
MWQEAHLSVAIAKPTRTELSSLSAEVTVSMINGRIVAMLLANECLLVLGHIRLFRFQLHGERMCSMESGR